MKCVAVFAFGMTSSACLCQLITDLGPGEARSVSNSGYIAGIDSDHAFRWTPPKLNNGQSKIENLGKLGGSYSKGMAVNDSGLTVGYADDAQGLPHAFTYQSQMVSRSGASGWAYATNVGGAVAGRVLNNSSGEHYAIVWNSNGVVDRPNGKTLFSGAYGMSDSGYVTGFVETSAGVQQAFKWTLAGGSSYLPRNGSYATHVGRDVNFSGEIAGYATGGSNGLPDIAVFWAASNAIQSLPLLSPGFARAYGINKGGRVVGQGTDGLQKATAVIWTKSSSGVWSVKDLNSYLPSNSGWHLDTAYDINDSGLVVGVGTKGGATRGFALQTSPVLEWTDKTQLDIEPSNLRLNLQGLPANSIYTRGGNFSWTTYKVLTLKGEPNKAFKVWVETKAPIGHDHGPAQRPHGWISFDVAFRPKTGPTAIPGDTKYSTQATGLSGTLDGSGNKQLVYVAPDIASNEDIVAVYSDNSGDQAKKSVITRFKGLTSLQITAGLKFGGLPAGHNGRFYGLNLLCAALKSLGANYIELTGLTLELNDMSIVSGGLLDVDQAYSYGAKGHIGHKLGAEIDVNLITGNTDFENLIKDQGYWIDNNVNLWKSEGNHYHLNISGGIGFPTVRNNPKLAVTVTKVSTNVYDVKVPVISRGGLDALNTKVISVTSNNTAVKVTTTMPIVLGSMPLRTKKVSTLRVTGAKGSKFELTLKIDAASPAGAVKSTTFKVINLTLP